MRENIYRGKRVGNNEIWIFGDLNHYACDDGVFIAENAYSMYRVHTKTVGQYTGINDIKSNKIFEHDIVRKIIDGKELIGVVEYSDGAFGVRFADGSGQLLCFFEGGCEVIGNIHDNPEITLK